MNAWRTNPKGRLRGGYNTQRITPYHMYPGGQVVQVWSWCYAVLSVCSFSSCYYCFRVYRKLITWSTHAGPQLKGPIVWNTKYQQILNTANKLEQIVREIGKGRWIKASKVYAHLKRSSHSQSARRQLPTPKTKMSLWRKILLVYMLAHQLPNTLNGEIVGRY